MWLVVAEPAHRPGVEVARVQAAGEIRGPRRGCPGEPLGQDPLGLTSLLDAVDGQLVGPLPGDGSPTERRTAVRDDHGPFDTAGGHRDRTRAIGGGEHGGHQTPPHPQSDCGTRAHGFSFRRGTEGERPGCDRAGSVRASPRARLSHVTLLGSPLPAEATTPEKVGGGTLHRGSAAPPKGSVYLFLGMCRQPPSKSVSNVASIMPGPSAPSGPEPLGLIRADALPVLPRGLG